MRLTYLRFLSHSIHLYMGTISCTKQVEPTQLGPRNRASLRLRRERLSPSIVPNWVSSTWGWRMNEVCEKTSYINKIHCLPNGEWHDGTQLTKALTIKMASVISLEALENHQHLAVKCRLLGYKNSVRTSQETHYFSTTESSQLMLCKTWGFHGCHYEECRLLGCDAAWLF
jgi:hypothetical protein